MLNTECKQCHEKWHHDNAKYCSMCGNKLVEEPEFKVGDYVVNASNAKWTGQIIETDGKKIRCNWYDTSRNTVMINAYAWFENNIPATPEEIAEYKAALMFHKHGRKPFELKEGDLVKESSSYMGLVDTPALFGKELFYKSGYELLKTAEELEEWLGADDE